AERAAKLVALELLLVDRKEVLRVELVIAREFEHRSVKRVAARLGRDVERRAGTMELGGVGVLLDAEFLQRIDGRLNPGAALVFFCDVHAVEEEARLRPGDAADDVAVDDL